METLHRIAASWMESLSLFKWGKGKQFALLALNALREAYRALITGAWWIMPIIVLLLWGGMTLKLPLIGVCNALLFFVALCAMRPSAGLKTSSYFWYMLTRYFPLFLLLCCAIGGVVGLLDSFFGGVSFVGNCVYAHALVAMVVATLFIVESGLYWQRLVRVPVDTFWFIVYNYPALMLIAVLYILCIHGNWALLRHLPIGHVWRMLVGELVWFICMSSILAVLTNFFIQRVYEQNRMYFND